LSYRYSTPLPILQSIITKRHFYELLVEENLSPRGEERADLRSAMVSATIARGFGAKNVKLTDFKLNFDSDSRKQSADDIMAGFKTIANVINENKKRAGK
jgi:hypothetical protein